MLNQHFIDPQGVATGVAMRRGAATSRSHASLLCSPRGLADQRADLFNAMMIIAHDLRGPLTNLSLMVELIEAHSCKHSAERVAVVSRKAQALIDGLATTLDGFLRRVRETGDPMSFTPVPVDLAEVVLDAIRCNEMIAHSRGIAFDCAGVVTSYVHGDPALLREAAGNLINNAVKHAPRGSTVTCLAQCYSGHAVVQIQDEGPGLTPNDLGKVFRPFATLSARSKGKPSSCGLGLWIVRLIAERHGGRVAAKSRGRGHGAVFSLYLPAASGHALSHQAATGLAPGSGTPMDGAP